MASVIIFKKSVNWYRLVSGSLELPEIFSVNQPLPHKFQIFHCIQLLHMVQHNNFVDLAHGRMDLCCRYCHNQKSHLRTIHIDRLFVVHII